MTVNDWKTHLIIFVFLVHVLSHTYRVLNAKYPSGKTFLWVSALVQFF